ncbi:Ca-activated chloride channel family protein [Poseidonocella pacifica]|uniref:Ca-activated chloride channel family protein n=1 Tax=Poseidonocella pacifica TaxID=871651 RepID=A0A1I0YIA9_9RHOB|nr:hypothetical protein [Poseidonocella pacifica]SFB12230.1 Ca-activated chloride channel family protein [Poseidonocella pacifica]
MKRAGVLSTIAAGCFALAALLGGTGPFGRVLMALGMPGMAAQVFTDPGWRGAAQYRAGDHAAAVASFREARDLLGRGNALVHTEDYAAALEAYDVARAGGDADAAANFDLVAAYYAGLALDPEGPIAWFDNKDGGEGAIVEASIAQGSARAAGAGDESTNTGALLGLPELLTHGARRVRKVFDDKFMVANERWLATLADVPGEYLDARIQHERKRRIELGLSPPEPEDPR